MRDSLINSITSAVSAAGFELWDCEFIDAQKVLRVYIDGPNGVNIDDCANVSRQVSGVLDVEADIKGSYQLEVSSPGISRVLSNLEHFMRYIGQEIKLQLHSMIDGRRRFNGVLVNVKGEIIELKTGDEVMNIDFNNIAKANVVG